MITSHVLNHCAKTGANLIDAISACLRFLQARHEFRVPRCRRPPVHRVLPQLAGQVLPTLSPEVKKPVQDRTETGFLGRLRRCPLPHTFLQTGAEISCQVISL